MSDAHDRLDLLREVFAANEKDLAAMGYSKLNTTWHEDRLQQRRLLAQQIARLEGEQERERTRRMFPR